MNVFLDTSSLFKLYHTEPGTELIDTVFVNNSITKIFLSEIAVIEFSSTVWKKVRTKEISDLQGNAIIELFKNDHLKFSLVPIDNLIVRQAVDLITKYGKLGLRTLDSIQLSTCVSLSSKCDLFLTSDKSLSKLLELESLPIK